MLEAASLAIVIVISSTIEAKPEVNNVSDSLSRCAFTAVAVYTPLLQHRGLASLRSPTSAVVVSTLGAGRRPDRVHPIQGRHHQYSRAAAGERTPGLAKRRLITLSTASKGGEKKARPYGGRDRQ